MIYAAMQYLLVGSELYIVRVAETDAVSDEQANVASVDIPVAGTDVIIQSNTAGPYIFATDSFFAWKLNGVLAAKTLVVAANDEATPSYSCTALANLLNDQLSAADGIEFFCGVGATKIGVSTTFAFGPDASFGASQCSRCYLRS